MRIQSGDAFFLVTGVSAVGLRQTVLRVARPKMVAFLRPLFMCVMPEHQPRDAPLLFSSVWLAVCLV